MVEYHFDPAMICPWDATATPQRIAQYRDYYEVKHRVCAHCNPRSIVEIGVRAGYSAYYFLQACPSASYLGFDADNGTHGGQGPQSYLPWTDRILRGRQYELWWPFDTQVASELPSADFYHIDGDHSFGGVVHDLDLCHGSAPVGGVMLVDDFDYIDEVRAGVTAWLKSHADGVRHERIASLRGEVLVTKLA